MKKKLKVLLIEDSDKDVRLLINRLKGGGFDPDFTNVQTKKELEKALKEDWDLVLSDYAIPNFNVLDALKVFQERDVHLPFIIVSRSIGENLAVECMRAGAHDYINKNQLALLIPAVERELAETKIRKEKTLAQTHLKESQAQTQAIVENAVEGIITIDEKGNIELFNRAAEKLFGYTREEMVGQKVNLLMPRPDEKNHERYIEQYLKTGKKKIIGIGRQVLGRRKDGSLFPLHISVSEIALKDRKIFTAILSDITEQKEMEQALKDSEHKFKKLYNEAPIMYFTLDPQGHIVEANFTAMEKLGYSLRELRERDLASFFLAMSREKFHYACQNLFEKPYFTGEGRIKNCQGEVLDVIFNLRLEKSAEAKPLSIKTTCVDISETKKLQQQLMHADRLASIGQLAAGISHEINQPLSCISMSSEILLSQLSKKTLKKPLFESELKDILQQLDRISKIIQNIKTFSRDFPQETIGHIQVNEVIYSSLSLIQRQFEKHGIILDLQLEDNLPFILGDSYRLEQVFVNFLLNSRDALEEKAKKQTGWKRKIFIATTRKKDMIEVCFRDNGTGIEKHQLQKIYDPFYTTKGVGLGTGLGLSIAYGIIGEMGGRIECQSEPGEWTLFKLLFPRAKETIKIR